MIRFHCIEKKNKGQLQQIILSGYYFYNAICQPIDDANKNAKIVLPKIG